MESARSGDSSVLVVDDDYDIREMLTLLLEQASYHVTSCANGCEALTYLETTATLPNIILLDLMMPIMNGVQLRAKLQTNLAFQQIPVIILSADPNVEQQVEHLGVAGFLKKPIRSAVLLSLIDKYSS